MKLITLLVIAAIYLNAVEIVFGDDHLKNKEIDINWIRDEMKLVVNMESFKSCLDIKNSSVIPDDPKTPISQPLVPHNPYIFQDVTVKLDKDIYQGTLVVNKPYNAEVTGQFEFVLSIDGKRYWRIAGDVNYESKKATLLKSSH